MNGEDRGPWFLLTGLVLGLAIGLAFAWLGRPIQLVGSDPSSLRPEDKRAYRALIAAAYQANGDLVRARARLDLLRDEDIFRTLAEQAQQNLAEGGSADEARALGMLAVDLGQGFPQVTAPPARRSSPTSAVLVGITQSALTPISPTPSATPTQTETPTSTPTFTPEISPTQTLTTTALVSATLANPVINLPGRRTATARPTITGTPTRTPIPRPTSTPTLTRQPSATPGNAFVVSQQEQVCDPALGSPLLQIEVENSVREPVPGAQVVVTWDGGEERFFTGLKPEFGLGYGDFQLEPGLSYTIRLDLPSQTVGDLAAVECQAPGGSSYWGGWKLVYVQP